jgi:hypothetical protein
MITGTVRPDVHPGGMRRQAADWFVALLDD